MSRESLHAMANQVTPRYQTSFSETDQRSFTESRAFKTDAEPKTNSNIDANKVVA